MKTLLKLNKLVPPPILTYFSELTTIPIPAKDSNNNNSISYQVLMIDNKSNHTLKNIKIKQNERHENTPISNLEYSYDGSDLCYKEVDPKSNLTVFFYPRKEMNAPEIIINGELFTVSRKIMSNISYASKPTNYKQYIIYFFLILCITAIMYSTSSSLTHSNLRFTEVDRLMKSKNPHMKPVHIEVYKPKSYLEFKRYIKDNNINIYDILTINKVSSIEELRDEIDILIPTKVKLNKENYIVKTTKKLQNLLS